VRAASVLDVTAEAVVEALESGSAERAAHEHAWGLSFRDLQVPLPCGGIHIVCWNSFPWNSVRIMSALSLVCLPHRWRSSAGWCMFVGLPS
jgi:hypothetical protein